MTPPPPTLTLTLPETLEWVSEDPAQFSLAYKGGMRPAAVLGASLCCALSWILFFVGEVAAMAGSSGDSVTRRSVASQFFTQEEGTGIDGMSTSERVSVESGVLGGCLVGRWSGRLPHCHFHLPFSRWWIS